MIESVHRFILKLSIYIIGIRNNELFRGILALKCQDGLTNCRDREGTSPGITDRKPRKMLSSMSQYKKNLH